MASEGLGVSSAGHHVVQCVCGRVLQTCRCPYPKTVIKQGPCIHQAVKPEYIGKHSKSETPGRAQ